MIKTHDDYLSGKETRTLLIDPLLHSRMQFNLNME